MPSRSVASWWAASCRARASDRCSPWEAWVRAGSPCRVSSSSSRWGPTGRDPPFDVLVPGLGQGVEQPAGPRPHVGQSRHRCGARPASSSGPRRPGPARPPAARGPRPARCPTASSRVSHTSRVSATSGGQSAAGGAEQGGPLAQDLVHLLGGPGRLGVDHGQGLVEEAASFGRPGPDHPDVLGGEHRGPQGLVEVAPAADALPVDQGPGPAGRRDLGLDGDRPALHQGLGPQDGPLGAPAAPWPPGATRGTTGGSRGRRRASSTLVLPAPLRPVITVVPSGSGSMVRSGRCCGSR